MPRASTFPPFLKSFSGLFEEEGERVPEWAGGGRGRGGSWGVLCTKVGHRFVCCPLRRIFCLSFLGVDVVVVVVVVVVINVARRCLDNKLTQTFSFIRVILAAAVVFVAVVVPHAAAAPIVSDVRYLLCLSCCSFNRTCNFYKCCCHGWCWYSL